MIKYNLKCNHDHEFESWFSDSNEFEKLKKKKLLECIYCSSTDIQKSIMSPMVASANITKESLEKIDNRKIEEKNNLIKLKEYVEKNFEFVGDRFAGKVRDVYYNKEKNKAIYGTATPEERKELADEGIDLLSIPWISKDN
tara:strand:+ start:1351 stop:1773 length:423 start_codon:yes stop_codon:yes gene_type:complete